MSDLASTPIHVAICLPCQDTVNAGFAYDMVRLVGRVSRESPDIHLSIFQNRGTIIPQQRETLVQAAMRAEATHVLWIDSDMRFPNDALNQLLAHGEPIVAANYSTRRQPILPTAEHRETGPVFTTPESTGLVEVSHCGMGLMLCQIGVFERMAEPWFSLGFNPKDKAFIGEDFFFCRKAREAGVVTLIDQDLSKQVRHAGEMEFRAEHACYTRDTMAARTEA